MGYEKGFMGYRRSDGRCGVRNHVVVMSSVACANGVVSAIAREAPEVKPITHTEGCGRGPHDVEIAMRTLAGLGANPNVAAVLVVGLGCEFVKASYLREQIGSTGTPVQELVIQEQGGSRRTAARGVEIVRGMLEEAGKHHRQECGWENLVLGMKCGGSDALSGVTANPLVGRAADWLAEQGGTVILSETTEMIGTERILSERACSPELRRAVLDLVVGHKRFVKEALGPFADLVIAPGNMEGGLSNITEKALGCIVKGGTGPINEIVPYGARPSRKGLVLMDTPGSDIFSITGMAAGGAQIMIFTTGRGTPVGFSTVPVIKVASNSEMYARMEDDMDVNAGRIIEGVSMEEAGWELIELVHRVASGEAPKAESNRQDCLSIHTTGPAF